MAGQARSAAETQAAITPTATAHIHHVDKLGSRAGVCRIVGGRAQQQAQRGGGKVFCQAQAVPIVREAGAAGGNREMNS